MLKYHIWQHILSHDHDDDWHPDSWAELMWAVRLDWSGETCYKRETVSSPCFQVSAEPRWRSLLSLHFGRPCSTRDTAVRDVFLLSPWSIITGLCTTMSCPICWFSDSLNSCWGRCGFGTDSNFSCQCNTACERFGDCCSDYNQVCKGKRQKQTHSIGSW